MEKGQLSFFEETNKRRKREIVLALDKFYLFLVFFIITLVISFSLGIEKGKKINLASKETKDVGHQRFIERTLPEQQHLKENNNVNQKVEAIGEETPAKESILPKEEIKKDEPKPVKIEKPQILYSIQVASYSRKDIAVAESNKLKKQGFNPIILEKGKYLALCVGKFKTKDDAKGQVITLKNRYTDCFIRKL